jgi:HEAT repeat protein
MGEATMKISIAVLAVLALGCIVGCATPEQRRQEEVEDLLVQFESPDAATRRTAILSLGILGSEGPDYFAEVQSPKVVAALTDCLMDSEAEIRATAASFLGTIGPPANSAESSLVAVLEDKDDLVRSMAADSLSRIGSVSDETVAALTKKFADPHRGVSIMAIEAVGRIGPDAEIGLPALREAMANEDARVRIAAAYSLWRVSGDVDTTVPLLREYAEDGNDRAIKALDKMDLPHEEVGVPPEKGS